MHKCGVVHKAINHHNLLFRLTDLKNPRNRMVLSGFSQALLPGKVQHANWMEVSTTSDMLDRADMRHVQCYQIDEGFEAPETSAQPSAKEGDCYSLGVVLLLL